MTQHTVTQHFAPPQPVCRILARIGDAQVAGYARMNEARRVRIARMYGVSA